jgi:hypothetical protein
MISTRGTRLQARRVDQLWTSPRTCAATVCNSCLAVEGDATFFLKVGKIVRVTIRGDCLPSTSLWRILKTIKGSMHMINVDTNMTRNWKLSNQLFCPVWRKVRTIVLASVIKAIRDNRLNDKRVSSRTKGCE